MVSLWDMLSLLVVCTTLGGTTSGAVLAGGGVARLGVGVVLGLALGLLSMMGLRKAGARVFRTLPEQPPHGPTPLRLPLTYLAALGWLLVPGPLLGHALARSVIGVLLP